MKMKRLAFWALVVAAGAAFSQSQSIAAEKILSGSVTPGMVLQSQTTKVSINMNALHRLDFIVKGSSCAVCLSTIQRHLQETPGVAKVAVQLKKPYGGVCIYDSTKLNKEKLLRIAKGDRKELYFDGVEEQPVKKIPLVLLPKHSF